MQTQKTARFDTRITPDQKKLFKYASELAGYASMSEFVVTSVQMRANAIVDQHNKIITSQKDRELFFNALINPPRPNTALRKAAKKYFAALSK